MARYKPIERGQGYFLTIFPDQLFDENSIEKTIDRFVDDSISTSIFDANSKNDEVGQRAISPLLKLKVILYGFSQNIESMRNIERMMRLNHPGFLFLSGGCIVDHSTLCNFLNENADGIKYVFSRLLMIFEEMKCIKWETIVIDGTRISSNASKEQTSNASGFMKKLKRYETLSEKILERSRRVNKSHEDKEISDLEAREEKDRIDRQQKKYSKIIEKIHEYEKEVEAGIITPTEQVNLTDRESRLLKKDENYLQGYNIQAAFSNNDILVAIEATDCINDTTLINPMVEHVETVKNANGNAHASEYLLDKGYFNVSAMAGLIKTGKAIYVAVPKHFTENWFLNGEHDVVTEGDKKVFRCKGNRVSSGRICKKENSYEFALSRKFCAECEHINVCWANKDHVKRRTFSVKRGYVDNKTIWMEYKSKIESIEWQYKYNRRIGKEHNFRDLKANNGLSHLYWRGKRKCNTISLISGIAYNLKKLRKETQNRSH